MREELKQREAELEKSLEDKQQLKSQVQNLKEGFQKLQNTHVMQVRDAENQLSWFMDRACHDKHFITWGWSFSFICLV